MNILNRLYNAVFSYGQKSLYPYEVACLYGFWEVIPDGAKLIFEEQLKRYGRVQRSKNGKHLGFFDNNSDGLCKSWPEKILFPFRSTPCPIAELSLCASGSSLILKAEIFVFEGRFAGIEFIKSPVKFQCNELINIQNLNVSQFVNLKLMIVNVELLKNPMEVTSAGKNGAL